MRVSVYLIVYPSGESSMATETKWIVKYKLPGDQVRTPREIVVSAMNQNDAKKVAMSTIPSAVILGGPQQAR